MSGAISPAHATDFTAGVVMTKMEATKRFSFVAGVVEGLAYSRYIRDDKKAEGMSCIYDWFYKEPKTIDVIYAAFDRYPDHFPGAVVAALANRKCGA